MEGRPGVIRRGRGHSGAAIETLDRPVSGYGQPPVVSDCRRAARLCTVGIAKGLYRPTLESL